MRKKTVQLVCDGCGKQLEADIKRDPVSKREKVDYPVGVSLVRVNTEGSEDIRTLELCPDCTTQLPEGTTRKRPVAKETTEKAATPAKK